MQTPAQRNRYVDFLRAASICLVMIGHWLAVAVFVEEGEHIIITDSLSAVPQAHLLTWLFQVMPVFFLVGGYVNGLGWQSAEGRGEGYASWLAGRLRRLVVPVLPVLAVWTFIGLGATGNIGFGSYSFFGESFMLRIASQFALLPAWFLVVYIVVVLLVPLSHRAWRRYGMASFWVLAGAAALVDLLALGAGWGLLGWLNYLFVWLAVHQLGYAWQAGGLGNPRRCLLWAAGGIAVLIALVAIGPYQISMVSVRGEEVSNSLPPRVTLLALGVFQGGLLLALEGPARRLLGRGVVWTATVLINGMIMTIFLWHVTALIVITVAARVMEVGLSSLPGTAGWWLTRPLWFAAIAVVLAPLVALFTRFERIGMARRGGAPPAWQQLLGCGLVCFGLATLTLRGLPTESWPGINLLALGLPFVGGALVWFDGASEGTSDGRPD